jgi:hypothetical protein
LLESKRLQDRIDSLEFYAKTNTNSSVFHNLTPSYSNSSSTSQNGSSLSSRARTPAPIAPRPRIASSGSGLSSLPPSYSTPSTSTTPTSYYSPMSASSYYDRLSAASRPTSRQSSIERTFGDPPSTPSFRLSDLAANIRSRNSSPVRSLYESGLPDRWSTSSSASSAKPPSSPYESAYNRLKQREASVEKSLYGNRPTASSSLLKFRRSSFVDNHHGPKYY